MKFVATKKGLTTNFFHPSLLLLFLDPGSGMGKNRIPNPTRGSQHTGCPEPEVPYCSHLVHDGKGEVGRGGGEGGRHHPPAIGRKHPKRRNGDHHWSASLTEGHNGRIHDIYRRAGRRHLLSAHRWRLLSAALLLVDAAAALLQQLGIEVESKFQVHFLNIKTKKSLVALSLYKMPIYGILRDVGIRNQNAASKHAR